MKNFLFFLYGLVITLILVYVLSMMNEQNRLIAAAFLPVVFAAAGFGGFLVIDNVTEYYSNRANK